MTWADDQRWEAEWWGGCVNSYGEETKQLTYAHRMGIVNEPLDGHWPVYDLGGRSVVDLGGGPASLLLKCTNVRRATVVDPCAYPEWVAARYKAARIGYVQLAAEDYPPPKRRFDEAWIYNVLQHVRDPLAVIEAAKASARLVRIFEWADTYAAPGHPQVIKPEMFAGWFSGGRFEQMTGENGCVGLAFYGAFSQ